MDSFLKFTALGLGTGGVYALLALGIVLVYRGSGVVNFANGAQALLAASLFHELRPDIGTFAAAVVGVVGAAASGALVHFLVMNPMRRSSPLARVIATLGLMTLIQESAEMRYTEVAPYVAPYLPRGSWSPAAGVVILQDRVVILGITVVLTLALALLYRRTTFGLATTAVAENVRATATLGWSPSLLAGLNWAAGGALAGLAGVLLVPIVGLSAPGLTLTVVPALSAALVGGFSSFPLTLVGGVLIGVLESLANRYVSSPGWPTAVPFILIITILVVRGRALPLRSHLTDRLPALGNGRHRPIAIAIGVALALLSLTAFTASWQDAVITTLLIAIVCLSVVIVTGYCGQLSLAQFALAGVGALVAGRLADAAGAPFPVAVLLGVLLTVPVGLLVALPALRARGVNLAVATLGFAVVITSVVLSNPDYTGGISRGTVIPEPTLFGWSIFSVEHPDRYAGLCLVVFLVIALAVANVRRGRSGRRLVAVRNNERAAASLGISVVGAKLYAFGLGAGIAALGGSLMAFRNPTVNYDTFDEFGSIRIVLYSVIGGVGFVTGAVVGGINGAAGVVEQILSHWFDIADWFPIVAAALLIAVVIVHTDGVASDLADWASIVRRRLRRRDATPSSAPAHPAAISARARQRVPGRSLRLADVSIRFGAVMALDRVSLEVRPGEVVGLIGPNGAGKTTLIDVATGFYREYSGRVLVDDDPIDGLSPHQRVHAGLTRSFQSLELFDDLTVRENLRAASDPRDLAAYLIDLVWPGRQVLSDAALASIDEFGLAAVLDKKPSELPYAQRRLVAIARAVAASPSILLLDEPAAGLDEVSTGELAHLIRRLADEWGMAVLLVEHHVAMVLETCDRVVALDFGAVIASGTPAHVRQEAAVVSSYLGAAT